MRGEREERGERRRGGRGMRGMGQGVGVDTRHEVKVKLGGHAKL